MFANTEMPYTGSPKSPKARLFVAGRENPKTQSAARGRQSAWIQQVLREIANDEAHGMLLLAQASTLQKNFVRHSSKSSSNMKPPRIALQRLHPSGPGGLPPHLWFAFHYKSEVHGKDGCSPDQLSQRSKGPSGRQAGHRTTPLTIQSETELPYALKLQSKNSCIMIVLDGCFNDVVAGRVSRISASTRPTSSIRICWCLSFHSCRHVQIAHCALHAVLQGMCMRDADPPEVCAGNALATARTGQAPHGLALPSWLSPSARQMPASTPSTTCTESGMKWRDMA